jgi:hypothetical protein
MAQQIGLKKTKNNEIHVAYSNEWWMDWWMVELPCVCHKKNVLDTNNLTNFYYSFAAAKERYSLL